MEEQKPVKPTLQEKYDNQLKNFKAQVAALKVKNAELVEKLAFQATKLKIQAKEMKERVENTKPVIAGKSLVTKIKNLFARVKVLPVKHIVCFKEGDEILYLHGYVLDNRRGGIVVREAKLVDYNIKEDTFFEVRDSIRPFLVPASSVQYVVAAPR